MFLGAFVFVVVFDYAKWSCIQRCITQFIASATSSWNTLFLLPNEFLFSSEVNTILNSAFLILMLKIQQRGQVSVKQSFLFFWMPARGEVAWFFIFLLHRYVSLSNMMYYFLEKFYVKRPKVIPMVLRFSKGQV